MTSEHSTFHTEVSDSEVSLTKRLTGKKHELGYSKMHLPQTHRLKQQNVVKLTQWKIYL